jgi:hypothetical protein
MIQFFDHMLRMADLHPFLAFCELWLIGCIVHLAITFSFKTINRFLRTVRIWRAGWPPAHLDADGDFKPEPKEQAE